MPRTGPVKDIYLQISKAIDWDAEIEDIMEAQLEALTFSMSLICGGCLDEFAQRLRERIPRMVAEATALEEANPVNPGEHKHVMN